MESICGVCGEYKHTIKAANGNVCIDCWRASALSAKGHAVEFDLDTIAAAAAEQREMKTAAGAADEKTLEPKGSPLIVKDSRERFYEAGFVFFIIYSIIGVISLFSLIYLWPR